MLGGHVRMGCTFGAGEFSFLGADLGRLSEGLVKDGPYREAVWVDYMSATGLLRLYGRQKGAAGALPDMDGIGFFEAYDRGEPEAAAALDQFGRYAAAGIYSIQAVVDVQRFAIGGGISARPEVTAKIRDCVDCQFAAVPFSAFGKPEIVQCRYGNHANLIGALWFHLQRTASEKV